MIDWWILLIPVFSLPFVLPFIAVGCALDRTGAIEPWFVKLFGDFSGVSEIKAVFDCQVGGDVIDSSGELFLLPDPENKFAVEYIPKLPYDQEVTVTCHCTIQLPSEQRNRFFHSDTIAGVGKQLVLLDAAHDFKLDEIIN